MLPQVSQTGQKSRVYRASDRVPVLKEMADPVIAGCLGLVVVAAAIGLFFAGDLFPGDENPEATVLQTGGGLVLAIGVYFTAVNIRLARAAKHAEHIATVLGLLDTDREDVRVGAVKLLEAVGTEAPDVPGDIASRRAAVARHASIIAVLEEVAAAGRSPSASAAALAITRLGVTPGDEATVPLQTKDPRIGPPPSVE